jgi:hypothetical protein
MSQTKLTSFEIDPNTAETLENLKRIYGVNSNAAVLRRALAIALIASKHVDDDNNILFIRRDGDSDKEVLVPQRF